MEYFHEKLHVSQRRIYSVNHNLRNHLLSIELDAAFLAQVIAALATLQPFCFANLRNGTWYGQNFDQKCYYKSTDGHIGQWNFSISRLNLAVARIAMDFQNQRVVVIADSTRRGKKFPDSMNFTIPIWCAVINGILFGEPRLSLPPWTPKSIVHQIAGKISSLISSVPEHTVSLIHSVTLSSSCGRALKPLVPLFCCPIEEGGIEWYGKEADQFIDFVGNFESTPAEYIPDVLGFTPIILVSVSSSVYSQSEHSPNHSWYYIQGAGDDEENWSKGLTSDLFWKHRQYIFSDDDPSALEQRVKVILKQDRPDSRQLLLQTIPFNITTVGESGIILFSECLTDLLSNLFTQLFSQDEPNDQEDNTDSIVKLVRKTAPQCRSLIIMISPKNLTLSQRLKVGEQITIGTDSDFLIQIYVAGSNKQESSLSRNAWSETIIPSLILFYDRVLSRSSVFNPSIAIVCQSIQLGSMVIMALLINSIQRGHEFNSNLAFSAPSVSPHSRLSKERIRSVLNVLQRFVTGANPPRHDMKELNKFFLRVSHP